MFKNWLCYILLIILISPVITAQVDIEPFDPTVTPEGDLTDADKYNQLLVRLAKLESKVDQTVTKNEMEEVTNFITQTLADQIEIGANTTVLYTIMIVIFALGAAFGFYLYLKGARRI